MALGFLTLLLGGRQYSTMSFLVLFSGSARRRCEQNSLLAIFMARIRALDTETVHLYELVELHGSCCGSLILESSFTASGSRSLGLFTMLFSMLGHEHSHDVFSSVSTERMTKAARAGLFILWLP